MMKLLGNLKTGLLFVISAPGGAGKTTLVSMLEDEFTCLERAITYTTRSKRDKEKESECYHFISEKDFEKKIAAGDFIEHTKVFNHYYGIARESLLGQLKHKHVILVIDTKGLKALTALNIPLISIFISPPSIEELEKRLVNRKSESKKSLKMKLEKAQEEIKMIPWYDYHIINEDLVDAYTILRSILIAEEHRAKRVGDYVVGKSIDQ